MTGIEEHVERHIAQLALPDEAVAWFR